MSPPTPDRKHPSDHQLAAYHDGLLTPAEEDGIQEHLVGCEECREAILGLAAFTELADTGDLAAVAGPADLPSPGRTEASWRTMRTRLAAGTSPSPPGRRIRRWTTSPPFVGALAAALAACLIGFPLWIAAHGGAGSTLVVLPPLGGGEVTRGVEAGPAIVRLGVAPAILALALPPKASYPAYRFEIRTPRGDLLLTAPAAPIPVATGPQPPAAGERPPRLLALALGRSQLPPGDYRLRLVGVRGSHGETLAEQALRVAG